MNSSYVYLSNRQLVRHVAITIVLASSGLMIPRLIEMIFNIDLSRGSIAIIGFIVYFIALLMCIKVFGIPFGRIPLNDFLQRIGLYFPKDTFKHILLGFCLAICTLSGMLVGSLLTGKYILDFSNITIDQVIFGLTIGIWEEIFWRGIMMVILLKAVKRVEYAFIIQCIVFGLGHIRGLTFLALIDAFSVIIIAIGFTYAAYKTKCLIASIVFHFIHDAFLFFVQVPGGEYTGLTENVLFYMSLWIMVCVGCLISKVISERVLSKNVMELYQIEEMNLSQKEQIPYLS